MLSVKNARRRRADRLYSAREHNPVPQACRFSGAVSGPGPVIQSMGRVA
jgi:hypothetical protein